MENVLPSFTAEGLLPPGDYPLSLDALRASSLAVGTGADSWDQAWRAKLVENLAVMVNQLWQVGVEQIFVNGSFVEDKDHPNDIDGYFVCEPKKLFGGALERELNLLDPLKAWTWDPESRKPYRGYPKKQLPMWHAHRVELYPHYGQISGIRDAHGHELQFPSAFRISRHSDAPKGIVQIVKEETKND